MGAGEGEEADVAEVGSGDVVGCEEGWCGEGGEVAGGWEVGGGEVAVGVREGEGAEGKAGEEVGWAHGRWRWGDGMGEGGDVL